MKECTRLSVILALEIIALEIGAYTYAALLYQERSHVLLETGVLCLVSANIGIIVTRPKAQVASSWVIAVGILALSIGVYFLTALEYHERAYTALGIGILCLLGGFAGIIMLRSIAAALSGMMVLGMLALGIGVYFLTILDYHGRAYMVLGTGVLCLLGSLVGSIVTQYKARISDR